MDSARGKIELEYPDRARPTTMERNSARTKDTNDLGMKPFPRNDEVTAKHDRLKVVRKFSEGELAMWNQSFTGPVVILCFSALSIATLVMVGAW
ncbi:hypothetical protein AC630_19005 [Bradyrhizobium sp. AS23.2]|nr:hypothetical protein AC630_19005 [Bradyrhizobium sp. AS23.2]